MEEDLQELLAEYAELDSCEESRVAFFEALGRNLESQKTILSFMNNVARWSASEERHSSPLDSRIFELLFYAYRHLPDDVLVIQYLPILLYLYLGRLNHKDKEIPGNQRLETLLLTLYNSNLELFSEGFRLPALSQSSVFHDASRIEINEMRAWKVSTPSSPPQALVIQRITAQSRHRVVACLLRLFNHHLGNYPKFILKSFCDTSITLLQKGYPKRAPSGSNLPSVSRIRLSGPGLLELLYGGYFCFYNDLQRLGSTLVDCVHFRAVADANAGVLSASRAAKSLLMSQGAQSVSVSTPTFSQIAKNMITNASFRTKKMGDDIPVVDCPDGGPSSLPNEGSVPGNNTTTIVINSQNANVNTASNGGGSNNGNKALASISEENGGGSLRLEEETGSVRIHQIHSRSDLKEKLISKLPLKKKNKSSDNNNEGKVGFSNCIVSSVSSSISSTVPASSSSNIISLSQPMSLNTSTSNNSDNKSKTLLLKKKAHFQNNGEVIEIDSLEQVEELIKKKNLPPETITIHSPESGTTLF